MTTRCAYCRQPIHLGTDCWQATKGVLGPRGFIPLEGLVFCSEPCLSTYFNGTDDPEFGPG